jgi:HEPN domain-containing protein
MKQLTVEWVKKAEGDFTSAQREIRARKSPNYDAAGFHAQQCVEKYLKGRLFEAGIRFTKTHDLVVLLNLALVVEPLWTSLAGALKTLSEYAVESRYPGKALTKAQAKDAVVLCRQVRRLVRDSLGIKP